MVVLKSECYLRMNTVHKIKYLNNKAAWVILKILKKNTTAVNDIHIINTYNIGDTLHWVYRTRAARAPRALGLCLHTIHTQHTTLKYL